MRTTELEATTFYATSDGAMVRPVEPIANDWVSTKDDDGNVIFIRDDCSNPFACAADRGVLVEQFLPTAALKPGKTPIRRLIVRPRDLRGTWEQYAAVYGDSVRRKVRARAEKDRARARADELEKQLRAALAPLGLEADVDASKTWREYGDQASHYRFSVEVRLPYDVRRDRTLRAAQQLVERLVRAAEGGR